MLSVVIPYYQRTPGLLQRAVRSVLEQQAQASVDVIVVDDSSPHPASEELGLLASDARVTVLRQPNGGPSAARNKGLDHLPADTKWVAFLDSDDWWLPGYARMVEAAFADPEVDLFFSDSRRFNQTETRLTWEAESDLNLSGESHEAVPETPALYTYRGRFFDLAIRRTSVMGPSCMAYRLGRHRGLRFDAELRGGEDRLFKLHLAHHSRKVRFATQVLAEEGEGVNIFDSVAWGTPASFRLAADYILMTKRVMSQMKLTRQEQALIRLQRSAARRDFIASGVQLIANRQAGTGGLWRRTLAADPWLLAMAPTYLAERVLRRFGGR